jgi:probable HAF family extracellular repeat protein
MGLFYCGLLRRHCRIAFASEIFRKKVAVFFMVGARMSVKAHRPDENHPFRMCRSKQSAKGNACDCVSKDSLMIATTRTTVLVYLFAFLSPASTLHAAPLYHVTDLGTLGGQFGSDSNARAINNNGQVVGISVGSGGGAAFLYQNGSTSEVGIHMGANGINNSGQITGEFSNSDGDSHAFIYTNGTLTDLGSLVAGLDHISYGTGINDSGMVVGVSDIPGYLLQHAFLYKNGTMTDLGSLSNGSRSAARGINDAGLVVGDSVAADGGTHAFVYDGSMHDLGGGSAAAINNNGEIVGYSSFGRNVIHAFSYSNHTMTDLGALPGADFSMASAINSGGQIVGLSVDHNSQTHASLWNGGTEFDLNNLLDSSGSGWTLREPYGINDNGWIVGAGTNPAGQTVAFLLTPTPEPSSLTLAVLGFLGLTAWLLIFPIRRRMAPA